MNDEERKRTTFGVAEVELPDGKRETWIASAGKRGYVPPRVNRGGAQVVHNTHPDGDATNRLNDAEQKLMREAEARNAKIKSIGATRDMCHVCQRAADKHGVVDKVATPKKD